MQDSKTNKYEENFRILLAILLSAAIGFAYLAAQQAADKLNAKDIDIGHLFGRASREFEHKLHEILKMDGMTAAQKCAIEAANANVHAITKLMNNEHF